MSRPWGSVVIPAHDEATVIAASLAALFDGTPTGALEVIVACNGCTDGTADTVRASGFDVTVLELPAIGKARAIREAERFATAMPRLYLDADTELHGGSAHAVLAALADGAAAARPPVQFHTADGSTLVRAYYSVRSHLPSVMGELYGSGVYGLSPEVRSRFGEFPDVVADDLFAARLVRPDEVVVVECAPATVRVPRNARSLVRTLGRVYRGNRQLATTMPQLAHQSRRSVAHDLAALGRSPRWWPAISAYLGLAALGRAVSLLPSRRWARDESGRRGVAP